MQDKKKRIHVKKMRYAGLLLVVPLLLAGCTKKEELLILGGESVASDDGTKRTEEFQSWEESSSAEGAQVPSAEEKSATGEAAPPEAEADEKPGVIYIHVCGAVRQSGVYELKAGSRVYEAVQAAGGFAEGADQNYVNQAQELSDGIKLVIPTLEEAARVRERESSAGTTQENSFDTQIGIVGDPSSNESEGEGQSAGSEGRININTASEAQLCDIPGIGATRAAAIAAYREAHGGFQKPEDIMKVDGIKEGMYEKIKDSISVN